MLKLLDAVRQLNNNNISSLNNIKKTLESRLDWLSFREPESSGMVYDSWSEKVDDLQEIIDYIEELEDESDDEKIQDLIEDIKDSVSSYQSIHGGLSRLKI